MTVNALQRAELNGETFEYVFFWGQDYNNGFLSNWYISPFMVDGVVYSCVEQFMMAQKAELFWDKEIQDKIMQSHSQKDMQALGRKIRNFDEYVWDSAKVHIVYDGLLAKFVSNTDLRSQLLNTGNKILVEASPYDKIWGVGRRESEINSAPVNSLNWQGLNLLGFTLMDVRDTLKSHS